MRSMPGRAVLSWVIVSAAVLVLGVLGRGLPADRGPFAPHKLTILFTGDTLGDVKPCGCHRDGDLGGVTRHSAYVKQMRESGGDILLADAGDAVYGVAEYARIKEGFFAKAFPLMAYDAVALGETELRYITGGAKPPLYGGSVTTVCANVVDAATGRLLADKPYVVKRTPAGLEVGIVSVVGDHLIDPKAQEKLGIRILPPVEALRKHIGELRARSDLVIVLSHAGIEKSKALASAVPGIDIILSGHSPYVREMALERVGSVLFMQTSLSGKHMGKLVLDIGPDRKIASSQGDYVPMGPELKPDAEVLELVATHDKGVEEYYKGLRAASSGEAAQLRVPKPFVSAQECRKCHEKEYDAWTKTDHAKAFETLRQDRRSADPECVSCHSTGFKSKGGYTSESETPQLQGVQCEVCHGPGVIHSRRSTKGYGAVIRSVCTQCHNASKSPKFDYNTYKQRIAH